MTEPWGFDFTRCRPTGSVAYDNFNGDIEFTVNNNESERWISPKNSYLSIRTRIVQTDGAGVCGCLQPIINTGASANLATCVTIPYINPNPAACFFSAATFNIGEESISNNQNIAPCNTLYRTLYESENEQKTVNSTNSIKYMSTTDLDVTKNKNVKFTDYFDIDYGNGVTGATGGNCQVSNRQIYALKNMMGFNKYNEIDINTQCLAPIMYSDDLIPPNTPFSLRLTTDSSFYLNLVNIAGGTTTPDGANKVIYTRLTSATSNSGTNNCIGIAVIDINLWLYRVHMPNAVSIPREIFVKQFSSTLHAITGTSDEFNIDFKKNRRLTHLAAVFLQKKSTIKCCQTDFSSGFDASTTTEALVKTNSPIFQLKNIRFEYAGAVYPFTPYELDFDFTAAIDTSKQSKGTFRAFYEFCNFSDGLRDRNGVLLTADQYIVSPIILFKTFQKPDNDDNTCICTLDLRSAVTNCSICVCAFYDEVIKLAYDQYGKFTGFEIY